MAVARAATVRRPWRSPRVLGRELGSRAERRGGRHVGARPRGRGARISPRSCRENSRSRRREQRATCARRPCSAVSRNCVHCMRRRSSRGSVPACRQLAVHIARRELAGLFEEHAKQHAASRGEARRAMAVARAATVRTPWRSPRLRSIPRSAVEQSAVAAGTSAHDWEVEVLAPPLGPAGMHSRSRRRERRATCARRPCSAVSRDCVHCIRRMQVP
jgi:hypothetical protein